MKLAKPVFCLVLCLSFATQVAARPPRTNSTAPTTVATASLTRGDVVKIVRREIRRTFALRDWHHYAGYIDEYTGPGADALFSLSLLDRATASGNGDSPVRVIVYEDYECPYCKRFETRTAPKLRHRFGSQAQFVYRFHPLDMHGKAARTEAIAGACIARIAGPKAFRHFTEDVFSKTASNGRGTTETTARLAETVLHASDVGIGHKALDRYYRRCTEGKTGRALIASAAAFKGVAGTPTLFAVDMERHQAWRIAGALPDWVFEALIANVVAGHPGDSDEAIEQRAVIPPN
jgi:protein-disulfide isomerase